MKLTDKSTDITGLESHHFFLNQPWFQLITPEMRIAAGEACSSIQEFAEIDPLAPMIVSINAFIPEAVAELKQRIIERKSYASPVNQLPTSWIPESTYKLLFPDNSLFDYRHGSFSHFIRNVNKHWSDKEGVLSAELIQAKMMDPGVRLTDLLVWPVIKEARTQLSRLLYRRHLRSVDITTLTFLTLAIPDVVHQFEEISKLREFAQAEYDYYLSINQPHFYWPLLLALVLLNDITLGIDSSGVLDLSFRSVSDTELNSELMF